MSNSNQSPHEMDSDMTGNLVTLAAATAAGAVLMYLISPPGRSLRQAGRDASHTVSDAMHDMFNHSSSDDTYHATGGAHPPSMNSDIDWTTSAHGSSVPTPPKPATAFSRLLPPALGAMVSPRAGGVAALVQSLRDQTWNPRTRNTALLGGALSLFSLLTKQRTTLTVSAGVIGTALLAKGTHSAVEAANAADAARAGRASVQIEQSIRIDASPEDVFDTWLHYENFPHFMANVVEVRDLGGDLSHWTVKGPAGAIYEWDSILTEQQRPHTLAWRTVPGAKVEQRGEVLLEAVRGGTRATVRMSYTPPAGKAGQAIATLLGSNPKNQLEQDLKRLKRLLERGMPPQAFTKNAASRSQSLR